MIGTINACIDNAQKSVTKFCEDHLGTEGKSVQERWSRRGNTLIIGSLAMIVALPIIKALAELFVAIGFEVLSFGVHIVAVLAIIAGVGLVILSTAMPKTENVNQESKQKSPTEMLQEFFSDIKPMTESTSNTVTTFVGSVRNTSFFINLFPKT